MNWESYGPDTEPGRQAAAYAKSAVRDCRRQLEGRGVDPADCRRLLHALGVVEGNLRILERAYVEAEDADAAVRYETPIEEWQQLRAEVLAGLETDPTSGPPRLSGVTSLHVSWALHGKPSLSKIIRGVE